MCQTLILPDDHNLIIRGGTSLGEMCHTLYLCLYFILKGLGLGFNLKFSENSSKIIKGPGVAAVAFGFWW